MSLKKVLIPIDDQLSAEKTFEWYLKNYHRENEHVYFVHIITPPNLSIISSKGITNIPHEEWERKIKEKNKEIQDLESAVTQVAYRMKFKNMNYQVVQNNKPADAILDMINTSHIDHIVMAGRDRDRMGSQNMVGTICDFVLHNVSIPMTIIPATLLKQHAILQACCRAKSDKITSQITFNFLHKQHQLLCVLAIIRKKDYGIDYNFLFMKYI